MLMLALVVVGSALATCPAGTPSIAVTGSSTMGNTAFISVVVSGGQPHYVIYWTNSNTNQSGSIVTTSGGTVSVPLQSGVNRVSLYATDLCGAESNTERRSFEI